MEDYRSFSVPFARFAHIYEPDEIEDRKVFNLTILEADLPADLKAAARQPRPYRGESLITISAGRYAPSVIAAEGRRGITEMSTILRCARDSNLQLNRLLEGIPMDIAVQQYESRSPQGFQQALSVRSVRVRYTDVLARYDVLLKEFWA